jgi:hypothetical protein
MQARRLTLSAVLAGLFLTSGTQAAELVSRTLSATADGTRLVLRLEVPPPVRREVSLDGLPFTELHFAGMRPEGSPGAPSLPVATRLVALPPGGSATLRVLESTIEDLGDLALVPVPDAVVESSPSGPDFEMLRERATYDPRRYVADGPKNDPARLGAPSVLRHQRIVPLEIRPLIYDPTTRQARLVRTLTVEITMRGGSGSERDADAVAPRLATSASWQRVYAGALLNAPAATAWRRAPRRVASVGGPLKSGLLRPGLLGEEEWKLRVRQTGPTRVTGAALRAAGFPDATPAAQLRVYLKRFVTARPLDPDVIEIPIQLVDTDQDGAFDPEDSFLFYGQHPRDDTTSEDTLARYSQENVYWLSIASSGTPARMRILPRRTGTTPGPTVFPQSLVYEEDRVVNKWVYGSNFETVDSAELYFWAGKSPSIRIPVAVPGRAPGASLGVCVTTQEDHLNRPYRLYARSTGRDSVLLDTNFGTSPPSERAPTVQHACGNATDAQLAPGDVTVILWPLNTGVLERVPFLDRIELDYQAQYVATGNRIRCTSGGANGSTAFPITGFTDGNLRAFDITDPKAPAAFDLAGAYTSGTLTLTDSVAAGATRTYLVATDASIPSITAELDSRDDILAELGSAPLGTYDVLVVAHDSFADNPSLQQWVAFRRSQGHGVRLVRTSDVYDAFRGGLPHYEAIHRLTQQAFTNWGIEFVLLVGDCSEDACGLQGDSSPNFVPSRVRYFRVTSSSGGENEYRNDLNDKYYAQVAGGPNDPSPDLLVGRFSVGTPEELAAIVDKTIRYETPDPTDDGRWRKRVLMFADDEWVQRPRVDGFYHLRECAWFDFEFSTARACDTADGAFPGDLRCVPFFLRRYSDLLGLPNGERPPIQPAHRPIPYDSLCTIFPPVIGDSQPHGIGGGPEQAFYAGLEPGQVGRALIDSVGEGVLFFSMQSHMARLVVTDEMVMNCSGARPFTPPFYNEGKPFIVFGFGCHMNEFGIPGENGFPFPVDCLGEQLVNVPSRGAVASYASSGYEFLGPNSIFNEGMWHVIFEKRWDIGLGGRPADSDTLASRWLLSELTTIAELQYAESSMIARYLLIGDPLLRLDAGVPRVNVDRVDNGFLQSDNRLVVRDTSQPLGLQITLRDEQGIDSLWVVKRLPGGVTVPIDSVTIVAAADTAAQILAKRAYTVSFQLRIDQCDFDVVVGARDLAGRTSEFVGRIVFESELLANGIPIQSGDRADPRTAFSFVVHGCTPIPPPLPLEVQVDGVTLPPDQIVMRPDSVNVNWTADFTLQLSNGSHNLRFLYAGAELARYDIAIGGFGMSEVLAFPNPLRRSDSALRIFFHLGEPIAGGHVRVVDVNGRTVLKQDLSTPGVVKSDVAVPPGSIGSGVGQDDTHWNYVELFRDGLDDRGDAIANGVYIYELYINGLSGEKQRKRDKIVIMR